MKIHRIAAREILDSRGNPTVSAICELEDGVMAEASVPSGASTGEYEAVELRDNDPKRFGGLGVLSAVNAVNTIIAPEFQGLEATDQDAIDRKLIDIDGTNNFAKIGADASLAVSMAVARASAISGQLELFEYLGESYGAERKKFIIPTPMFNVLNGGKHAGNNIDIQETMIVPVGLKTFEEKLRCGAEIYQTLKHDLANAGLETGLGDEGGFAPEFITNEDPMKWAQKAIEGAGYDPNKVRISLDVAADSIYNGKKEKYELALDKLSLDSVGMVSKISSWVKKYNLLSVEDGLFEEDLNWKKLTLEIDPAISIGDDLFVTHAEKIEMGAREKMANGVIIKPNQVGTITQTFEAVKIAQKEGFKVIVSHRSGETEDSFIADLAVAVNADFIKSGAPARSERLAKYNRLCKIEDIINENY